jgi:hypothetical protein
MKRTRTPCHTTSHKFLTTTGAAILIAILGTSTSIASGVNFALYHSYDGLVCGDCHQLAGDNNGQTAETGAGSLHKSDITYLCLACHKEGNNTPRTADLPDVADGGWVAPIVMSRDGKNPADSSRAMPAGDFYWSAQDHKKGHNPAYTLGAVGNGPTSRSMPVDPILDAKPPGGMLSDGEWSCHSCHSSHSRFDAETSAWRQLKRLVNGRVVTGDVTQYGVESALVTLTQDPGLEPLKSNSRGDIQELDDINARADGHALEGADLFRPESDSNKNEYRGGFSSFCAACHGLFHAGPSETTGNGAGSKSTGAWVRHPTDFKLGEASEYGLAAYTARIINAQGNNPNPMGYDWKYPLAKADNDFAVLGTQAAASVPGTVTEADRIMCLTCHKAHASRYANMTRWDTNAHAFIADGRSDFTGTISEGDNPAFGCGKCHQMGGVKAFVKSL